MGTSRLTAQAAIIGLGRLLNMAAAAGTLMVLSRVMPDKESYGAICQLIMLYMVLSQIFAIGIPQSTFYFLPRYRDGERRGFLTQSVLLLMLSGLLLGAGLFIGAPAIGVLMGSPLLTDLLRIFAVYPVLMLPTLAVEGTLLHVNRPASVVLFNASVRVGMFCSLVIPTVLQVSLTGTISTWMVVGGIMWAVAILLIFSTVRGLPCVWRRDMLREEWKFSLPLAAVTLISISSSYIDRFFVSHAFGAAAFGVYTNGTIEIPTVTMVTNAAAVVLLAEFSRRTSVGDFESVLPIWHRAMIKTAILIFASFGFFVFWAHEAIHILFTSRFAQSGDVFSVYVWIVPLLLFAMQPLYVSIGATRVLMAVTACDLVLCAIFTPLFGHFFGLVGMAVGSMVGKYLGTSLWVHWYVRWLTKIGWKAFMPWRKIGTAFLVALAAGGMSRLLHVWLGASWPVIAVFALGLCCYAVLYLGGMYATRLLNYIVPARYLPSRRPWREEVAV